MASVLSVAELASSLTQEEIPIKLRCAICNKVVVNAFRLPCCDQSICEACKFIPAGQSQLPEACPVCAHSPLSADDCKPNKALRLTVKAFLKSEEKKRNKERSGTAAAKPDTPTVTAPAATPKIKDEPRSDRSETDGAQRSLIEHSGEQGEFLKAEKPAEAVPPEQTSERLPDDASKAQPNSPVNTTSKAEDSEKPDNQAGADVNGGQHVESGLSQSRYDDTQNQNVMWNGQGTQQMYGNGFGFGSNQAGFTGMDWGNSGFGQMMPNGMSNGMNQSGWNGFSQMMGMPGMGMDAMGMTPGMFGGFGGQGMGMNMGMGFDGGYAAGWGGQQMSGSDFGGAQHAAYYPGGGYNQQSHQGHFPHHLNQMNHHQAPFHKHNYQNQNRFHGQGGYTQSRRYGSGQQTGFGGGQAQALNQTPKDSEPPASVRGEGTPSNEAFHHQLPSGLQDRSSQPPPMNGAPAETATVSEAKQDEAVDPSAPIDTAASTAADSANVDDNNKPLIETNHEVKQEKDVLTDTVTANNQATAGVDIPAHQDQAVFSEQFPNENAVAVGSAESVDPYESGVAVDPTSAGYEQIDYYGAHQQQVPIGMSGQFPRGRGGYRAGYGRGSHDMRGGYYGRGSLHGSQALGSDIKVMTPVEPIGQGVEGAPTGPKAMREGNPRGRGAFGTIAGRGGHSQASPTMPPSADGSRGRRSPSARQRPRSASRSKSRSRSRSRSPSRERNQHRHRYSRSPSADSNSHGRRRERRRRRSSRKDHDDDGRDIEMAVDVNENTKERSRDHSVASSSRPNTRRDPERERDKRSSRSYRERSYDRDRDRRKRRHRSRSNDRDDVPDKIDAAEHDAVDHESSRRKTRSDRYQDQDRDHERERDRHRDRDRRRDRDRSMERLRERSRDRKRSRRERSPTPHDMHSSDDRHHRRSHRRRRDRRHRDKGPDRERERERDHNPDRDPKHPPAAAETEFKIQGRSRAPPSAANTAKPPTPTTRHPPSGPAADRHASRRSSTAAKPPPARPDPPSTPAGPAPDPHTLEREARNRERLLKEQQRRLSLQFPGGGRSAHQRRPSGASPTESKKRGFAAVDGGREEGKGGGMPPPTEPSGFRGGGGGGRKARRVSYKYEDEENDEARVARVEREREGVRG